MFVGLRIVQLFVFHMCGYFKTVVYHLWLFQGRIY